MTRLLVLLLLVQTPAPVNIVDPTVSSKKVTTTTSGGKVLLDVNCPNCTGGTGGGSGSSPSYVNALIDGGFVTVQIVQSVQLAVGFDGGSVTAFQGGTWSGVGVTGPLTDAQLRASRVPVFVELDAGFVSVANFPATQTINGTVTANAGSGTLATSNANLDVALSTRTKPSDQQHTIVDSSATVATTLSGQPAVFIGFDAGFVSVANFPATQTISAASLPLPTGASTETTLAAIKAKTDNLDVLLSTRTKPADSQTVTGTVAATQSGTWTVQPGNTANTTAWKVDGSGVTQPINGTVTANAGTNLNTSALALDATLTGRTQKAQITDGTRDGTVKAASTAAQAADTSLVVGLSPNSALPTGSNVIGHVIADTGSTMAVTGTVAVSGPLTDTQLRATPVPVSGTVTANAGSGTMAVSLATLPALTTGSAVIGHVIADTGSTTTVTQATGTNLHAVLDATSTTTVTQATGTNLHTVVDSAPTTAVTQSTSPWVENVSQFGGTNVSTGTGTSGAGIPRVTVSSDSFPVSQAVTLSGNPVVNAFVAFDGGFVTVLQGVGQDGGAWVVSDPNSIDQQFTLNLIRRTLEEMLLESKQQTLYLQSLHSPGNGPP